MVNENDFRTAKNRLNCGGLCLTDTMISQLMTYYNLLIEKNKVMNLTAITDFQDVLEKHFLDSLSIVRVMDMNRVTNMIDIGTGAGFPGIPIKIAFPQIRITLADSLQKRLLFLDEVIAACNLDQISTIHGRAEDLGKARGAGSSKTAEGSLRETFDLCVSRAVANLSVLCELCLPFVRPGGFFVSYKAGDCDSEVKAAAYAAGILGGEIIKAEQFTLPGTDLNRTFIVIEKKSHCPAKYPRRAGTPSREPLIRIH